jgi:plastocyanin
MHKVLIFCAVVVVSGLLAGCGGGGDTQNQSESSSQSESSVPPKEDTSQQKEATSQQKEATNEKSSSTQQGGNVWGVSIQDYFFEPAEASVESGDEIVFTNEGAEPHTVTTADGQFDSGVLNPGASFTITVSEPGTLTYYCAIHPEMVGNVTVRGGSGGGAGVGEEAAPVEGQYTIEQQYAVEQQYPIEVTP